MLAKLAAEARPVRLRGGGTKLGWGGRVGRATVVCTDGLDAVLEHNAADLTAVLQAGVPLARAQARFATAGQMLALDPPLGPERAATIGGVVATADSGPLRHRYGAPRDLLLGMTVALSDGAIARSGGKVIKNVAGYDLAKLFAGSFGTLGLILEVAVRLHPVPAETATAVASSSSAAALQRAAIAVAAQPLELQSLDVAWDRGEGTLMARAGGAAARARSERAAASMESLGVTVKILDGAAEERAWVGQRTGQRSASGLMVRVAGRPSRLATAIDATEALGGSLVGRAGLGVWWIRVPLARSEDGDDRLASLRRRVGPMSAVVLDGSDGIADPWGSPEEGAMALMRRVRERFDPAGICNPGIFVGGL